MTPLYFGRDDGATRWRSVFTPSQRLEIDIFSALWLAALLYLWAWWFSPELVLSVWAFVVSSLVLAWITVLPTYFIVVARGARRLVGRLQLGEESRIAMIVTKAPSEPFGVVVRTLEGMLAQDLAHDTWLADEAPTAEIIEWCRDHGVRVSTRQGRADYHRAAWPRRTKCKEGNLAFFYDCYGFDCYDFVSQLDADHVPAPSYLREMMRPFSDPGVGYVSAPSICSANADLSWAARGRLNVEAPLHGLIQAGHNNGWAPICIGSHYAIRTSALREIGGLGPELAEDHSTTLMMNAHGWRGVHALDAVALGDGPGTFADMITQEFQWSRSMTNILLVYMPNYFGMLPTRLKFQFLFCQFWYPMLAASMTTMFSLPLIALAQHANLVNVTYPAFLIHSLSPSVILLILFWRLRSFGILRPAGARIVCWEGVMFVLAKWPWVLLGVIAALRDCLVARQADFRVTPKGKPTEAALPTRAIAPYFIVVALSCGAALTISDAGASSGFYLLAGVNSLTYVAVLFVIIIAHWREQGAPLAALASRFAAQGAAATLLLVATAAVVNVRGLEGLRALSMGLQGVSLVETKFRVSGAGLGVARQVLRFNPKWTVSSKD